ncbi:unnamed protein product [Rodentolepis nana]|uniref:Aldedh domain-containing protein n=1 Tax=Rodentolepis nana TaxID=102285 RepID=A0A0R3U0M2_RODNA|nr:unnamed protein product [Rodentolepis nana]
MLRAIPATISSGEYDTLVRERAHEAAIFGTGRGQPLGTLPSDEGGTGAGSKIVSTKEVVKEIIHPNVSVSCVVMTTLIAALLPPIRRCLSSQAWRSLIPEGKALIGGTWRAGSSGQMFPVYNPANEEKIADVPSSSSEEDLDIAIVEADEAQKSWSTLPAGVRSRVLENWANSLESNTTLLAQLITAENGKVDTDARGEINSAIEGLRWYANEARCTYGKIIPSTHVHGRRLMVIHQPVGVVAMITPWNFPLSMLTRKAGAALAAGCSVVLKPSDETPLTALAAVHLATSPDVGLDPRLLSILPVPANEADKVGKVFCSHPLVRQIGFTGSTAVGMSYFSSASITRLM